MPLHDGLEHGLQEPPVTPSLILRAAGDGVRDVAENSVVADQCWEVGSL